MQIKYSRQAVKTISRLNNPIKQRIKIAIEKLPDGDIKKLKGYTTKYRLRVGDYRVIFDMCDNILTIGEILPRGEVYKNL